MRSPEPTTILTTDGGSPATRAILIEHQGDEYRLDLRVGVIPPQILVPREPGTSTDAPPESRELGIGTPIRLIREPYFGLLATVSALPPELVRVSTGGRGPRPGGAACHR